MPTVPDTRDLTRVHAQTRIVALMTVLSQHAPNEHYLSDEDQGFVYVRPVAECLFSS